MTFGLRSLGARSSGRKEPSGRRHRLQTAMASLPQNESMGKILRDVCCKLLSSALLRSDGESVFMLTAESRQRSCAPFCTWQREVETERGAVVPIEPGSFERNKARWHKRLKPRHEASKVNSRCIAPTFGHALTLPDLAPPSSLGFLTVSQRHCQSAGKKKERPERFPIRVYVSRNPWDTQAWSTHYTHHISSQKAEKGARCYSRYRMTSRYQLFQSTAPWAQAAMRAATPRKPSGTRRVRLEPRAATDNSRRFWSRFKAYICCICSQNPTTKKLYKREETYQKSPEIKMERNSRLSHNWPRMVMQGSGSCQHGTKCRITHWVLRAVSDAPNKLWSQGFAWPLPCYK